MSITWRDYIHPPIGNAHQRDLQAIEQRIGVTFPQDYKDCVANHQGKSPDKETLESGDLAASPFGPLYHLLPNCEGDLKSYGVLNAWQKWSGIYSGLVPIADCAGSGCFYAFDFRANPEQPTIVFVDVEEDPEDEDAILFVAHSFTDMINALA